MNPLFLVLALSIPEVNATDPFGLDALLDDTAAPVEIEETRSASWPTSSRIDQIDRNLTVQWPDLPTHITAHWTHMHLIPVAFSGTGSVVANGHW